jgi:hypothetical protein
LALDRKDPEPHREVPGGRRSHLRRLSFAGEANGAMEPVAMHFGVVRVEELLG